MTYVAGETGCVVLFLPRQVFLDYVAVNPIVLQKYIQLAVSRLWRVAYYTLREFLGTKFSSNPIHLSAKSLSALSQSERAMLNTSMGSIDLDTAIERESSMLSSWMAADWLVPDGPQQQDIEPSESEMEDMYPSDSENISYGVRPPVSKSISAGKPSLPIIDRFKYAVKETLHSAKHSLRDLSLRHINPSQITPRLHADYVESPIGDSDSIEPESGPATQRGNTQPVAERIACDSPASLASGWDVIHPDEIEEKTLDWEMCSDLGRKITLNPGEMLHGPSHRSHSFYLVLKGCLVVQRMVSNNTKSKFALVLPYSICNAASFLTSTVSGVATFASMEGSELVAFGPSELQALYGKPASIQKIIQNGFLADSNRTQDGSGDDLDHGQRNIFVDLMLTTAKALTPIIRQFDLLGFQIVWFRAGDVLYRQGERANTLYIIINGRCRLLRTMTAERVISEEDVGRGDSVGAVSTVVGGAHDTTCLAVRDMETVRMSKQSFEILASSRPKAAARLLQGMARRLTVASNKRKNHILLGNSTTLEGTGLRSRSVVEHNADIATIAIIPAGKRVIGRDQGNTTLLQFARELCSSLSIHHGTCTLMDIDTVRRTFPVESNRLDEPFHRAKVTARLSQAQEDWRFIILVGDGKDSPWSAICADHADCCLLVAEPGKCVPEMSEIERRLVWRPLKRVNNLMKSTTQATEVLASVGKEHVTEMLRGMKLPQPDQKNNRTPLRRIELVLVHEEDKSPQNTASWLHSRPMLIRHHHVRLSSVEDINRVGRWISGKAVGLVLSGGGSRGLAHVGVLKAMHKAKVPIDVIGGTSQGAFIAGLYAQNLPWEQMLDRVRKYSKEMGSIRALLSDLTLPILSVFSGSGFDRVVQEAFDGGSQRIEDLWLQFYAVTTNLSAGASKVHVSGVLWKAVRASMTLIGLVPPVVDRDGALLCDGGYTSNIPVDALMALGVGESIVVDVEDKDQYAWNKLSSTEGGISGWKILWDKLCPFKSLRFDIHLPSHAQLMNALTWMAHQSNLLRIADTHQVDLYLRPPVWHFKLADFRFMEIIVNDSARYAFHEILKWKKRRDVRSAEGGKKQKHKELRPNRSIMCMTQLHDRYLEDD